MSVRRLTLTTLTWLCALAGGLVFSAPASASVEHVPAGSFGQGIIPTGGLTGIAVNDTTHDVYALDQEGIQEFTATGEYIRSFGPGGVNTEIFSSSIAIDNSGNPLDSSHEDVYVLYQEGGYGSTRGVIEKFSAEGVSLGRFGSGASALGVGPEGTVWTGNRRQVSIFSDAEPNVLVSTWTLPEGYGVRGQMLVNSEDDLYAEEPHGFTKFNSSGGAVGEVPIAIPGGGKALAMDTSNNEVYLVSQGDGFEVFGPTGGSLQRSGPIPFPIEEFRGGIAVDSSTQKGFEQTLYLLGEGGIFRYIALLFPEAVTGEATGLESEGSATLNGVVNPEGEAVTSCEFEYGLSTSYGQTAPCEPTPGEGKAPVAVHARVAVTPDTRYHYRLVAGNKNGVKVGEDHVFVALARPRINSVAVDDVASSSASLVAQVTPGGLETTYRFEYGLTSSYGTSVPVPEGTTGSGIAAADLVEQLQGLQPDTTYHFRLVVGNALQQEVAGPDLQFTTQPSGGEFVLPDARAWELVTPPDKYGAGLVPIGGGGGALIQAAEGGGAITYAANAPIVAEPPGNRSFEETQVLSRRGPDGWVTQDIATPRTGTGDIHLGEQSEYHFFSSDLSLGLVQPASEGEVVLELEKTPYLRNDLSGEYEPLLTTANTLPGTKYGQARTSGAGGEQVDLQGAAPDLDHFVLQTEVPLIAGAVENSAYEWSGGQMQLVSVLPASDEGGKATSGALAGRVGSRIASRYAISSDGSRVFWEDEDGAGTKELFLRDMVKGETVKLGDVSNGGAFQVANSEGTRAFFTTNGDLDVFEVTSGPGEPLAGGVTDLTKEGGGGGVQGEVIGASEDGTYVYFVATAVLGDGAEHGAKSGGDNLYLEHYEGGEWLPPEFIAAVSGADHPDWTRESGGTGGITSRVSPNGHYLAFMSSLSVTGYDNRDASSGEPDEEVFLYDAQSGRLVCASCDPTGARPVGVFDSGPEALLVDANVDTTWGGSWLAASIPGWTEITLSEATYQSRYLSDSGRLFFDSVDPLVPADVNGLENVYEYEPEGIGSCRSTTREASVVFSEGAGGCVGLISSGTSKEESAFLDASEGGGEVFFLTSSRLVPQDYDNAYDVYVARECTGASPCLASPVAPPACTTAEACRAAPTPQPAIFGAPASATFSGAGNITPSTSVPSPNIRSSSPRSRKLAGALKACRRKPRRKRAGCEARARKRYGASKSKAGGDSSARVERRMGR